MRGLVKIQRLPCAGKWSGLLALRAVSVNIIGEYLAYELVKYGGKLVLSARRKAELERVKKNCAGSLN